jgi:predicted GNAT superfamily acetyltransferase
MDRSGEAWHLARSAAERAGVSIVPLTQPADLEHVSTVLEQVWGPEQQIPEELLRALQHAGVVLYGAESDRRSVGFVFGFLGFEGGFHLHSHMLAVLPSEQDRGVGYALKLAQRAACLDRGIDEVRWTFDPLVARNARFNLVKLGAVAFRYLPGFYGQMTDRLNRDDRSDRFEVRWKLTSSRVDRAIRRGLDAPTDIRVRIDIPRDYHQVKERDAAAARTWRESAGRKFQECFGAGLVATWLTEEPSYVFEPEDPVGD